MALISISSSPSIGACLKADNGQAVKSDARWDEGVFTIHTVCLAEKVAAIWRITKEGTPDSPVNLRVPYHNAQGVIKGFSKQPLQRKSRGIFIHSPTYAIPDTPEEHQVTTEYAYNNLYLNPEWRKSENALVKELQIECKKKGIPLYVNQSANLHGPWKKLAP